MEDTKSKLIEKSKEAFILAIELYNKPTIKYRVEVFCFCICNAWELMLKAHIIEKFGENAIYYDGSRTKTISLSQCVKKIFTNEKSPICRNLKKIIDLRNTSTHFITEEYELIYVSLFQSCVLNFAHKMNEFHGVDVSSLIPQGFLYLTANDESFDSASIRDKYEGRISNRLLKKERQVRKEIKENGYNNAFAITVEHHYYITKDKNSATDKVYIDNNSNNTGIRIVKELKDPNSTYPYNQKRAIAEINRRLKKHGIHLVSPSANANKDRPFNRFFFQLFVSIYDVKSNSKYCYTHILGDEKRVMYSEQLIQFMYSELARNPDKALENLKKAIKKVNPRGKGILSAMPTPIREPSLLPISG